MTRGHLTRLAKATSRSESLRTTVPAGVVRDLDLQLGDLAALLEDRGMGLRVTESARAQIAEEGYDPTYGARPLKRVIQRRVQNPLAMAILEGGFGEGDTVVVDWRDGAFAFE